MKIPTSKEMDCGYLHLPDDHRNSIKSEFSKQSNMSKRKPKYFRSKVSTSMHANLLGDNCNKNKERVDSEEYILAEAHFRLVSLD